MQKRRSNRRKGGYYSSRDNHNKSNNRRKNGISSGDINAFIQRSVEKANKPMERVKIKHTFSDFDFSPIIQNNLKFKKYVTPTPIQDQAIKPILEGRDLIGIANTGTGKTAAFLLPMLDKVYKNRNEKVLIVTPTRELAQQIEAELHQFSYRMNIFYTTCVGGIPINKQIRSIQSKKPNFIIGTPGRIKDLENRGLIDFQVFQSVVLDEVDRMLDMGFVKEIQYFLSKLPQRRQSLYFSATLSPKIRSLIETFSRNPVSVHVKSQEISSNIKQEVIRTRRDNKFNQLKEILEHPEANRVLVFAETKRNVDKLSKELTSHGFKADSIHGDKRQTQRQRALNNFKESRVDVLVATDVAARGLDIREVTHVINYTVPQTYEDYIHRIGRTGRGSSLGTSLTFVE